MPQDWFQREAWPVLAGLCRATVEVNHLSAEMTRLFKGRVPKTAKGWKRYLSMSRTRANLMALIGNLSGKLRLNHQSRFDRTQAANIVEGRAAKYPRPWEGYDIRRGAGWGFAIVAQLRAREREDRARGDAVIGD
jgi:hypothetical protein